MNRRVLTLVLQIFFWTGIAAQDPHFSQLYSSLYYSDPSSVSRISNPVAGLNYRNQWPGIENAFVTYGAYYFHPVLSAQSSIGLSLMHDVQGNGVISKTHISGIYTYSVQISEELQLAAGVQASFVSRKTDPDKLTFETDFTSGGSYSQNIEEFKTQFADFSLGFSAYIRENLTTGIALHHLTTPNESNAPGKSAELNYRGVVYMIGNVNIVKVINKTFH
ncbi:MAG: PorP/SprF family type IX secretion system membrane protein [Bacteroidales bacterium]|nr:PorP/SprF family type IX secretion system membrane protein [Bacteroidales bacterium]